MWRLAQRVAVPGRPPAGCAYARLSSWACLETPNPNVRKFELSPAAAPPPSPGPVSLSAAQSQLRLIDGVRDVFVPSGGVQWVSITRATDTNWEILAPRVQAVLEQCPPAAAEGSQPGDPARAADGPETSSGGGASSSADVDGVGGEIAEILEHRVRPSVQADGGDVELVSWDPVSGDVLLRLSGACRGCPQSAVTLQETILRTLQHFVPAVRSVQAKEDVDDDRSSDPKADIPFEHTGEPDPEAVKSLKSAGTPFFSVYAGIKMEGPKLRPVRFISRLELAGRTPEHIFLSCPDCRLRRTIEDPNDLLLGSKGNTTGNAAIVICPTCCVLITP